MENNMITFNDLPMVVAQLRDEVMSLKSLLTEQHRVNNAKAVDTHVPMSVEEAASRPHSVTMQGPKQWKCLQFMVSMTQPSESTQTR